MEVGRIDRGRLVFVDEMGTHTSLAPLYAYAPIGKRAFFEVPRNRGSNTALLSSLRSEGVGPSMVVEGATNKEVFEAYAEHFLAPALRPGEIVVMDNLFGAPAEEDKGVDRVEGMRATLPTALFSRSQPDRRTLLEGQAHPQEDWGSHQRSFGRGDGSGIRIREC